MNLQEAKLGVIQKIMSVSKSSLLEKIDKLLEEEMVVGYTVEGKPLTKEAYNLRLQKAEEQLKSGLSITQEELESESENW
jgi:actin-like ATPase involved in cell morphogenesis